MEILVLAALGFALVATLIVVFLKILVALVLVPFKIVGALLGGAWKLAVTAACLGIALVILAALPILLPVAIVSGVAIALLC